IDEIEVDDFETYQSVKGIIPGVHYRRNGDLFVEVGVSKELEDAQKRVVWLKNGAYLLIDQTETMTIIDVNTGKFIGKSNQEDTVLKTNVLAAQEVGRQLRLRDIGGMILVDFINMKENRQKELVKQALVEATAEDRSKVQVFHFTSLGLLEITRKRRKKDLTSFLTSDCTICNGKGYVKSATTLAYELERELMGYRLRDEDAVHIACSRDVKEAVEELITKEKLEKQCGLFITFEIQYSPLSFYNISRFGSVNG
ncbi:MAG: ribonuclease E/G, partial [Bacilli bacterium]